MSSQASPPGFYGKLPTLGDFVTRRLPRSFIDVWDNWLQSSIAVSREQLDADWLEVYLTSPIWRFVISPGLSGTGGWAGVMMPSVDRVGRYFPMTVATYLGDGTFSETYLVDAAEWFERIEDLTLSGLADGFDLDRFDQELLNLAAPAASQWTPAARSNLQGERGGRRALQVSLSNPSELPEALNSLAVGIGERLMPVHSIWTSEGSERVPASLLACDGLPPANSFVALMTGDWHQRGWQPHGEAAEETRAPVDASAPSSEPVVMTSELEEPTIRRPIEFRWQSHDITVVGNRRKINEDSVYADDQTGLWVVADGMGGHQAGDVASLAIIDALKALKPNEDESIVGRVRAALESVNGELHRMGEERLGGQVVGSTVVALMAQANRCTALWAGDSRLYRYRAGQLEQLTADHSLLDEMIRSGMMNPEQLAPQANNNIITRAVGAEADIDLEATDFFVEDGDVLVLCSDGLVKELDSAEIAERLASNADCDAAAQALIDGALAAGGRDNISVIVIRASRVR